MEFGKKLQELRKSKGLTQEELAEELYISRTAVSKWESGRGYPSIDSLKEISKFFSVTIDELLSGEKLIAIAENENKANVRGLCDLLFGMIDVFSLILIILPIYPGMEAGYIRSVNLFAYTDAALLNRWAYWTVLLSLMLAGAWKVVLTQFKKESWQRFVTVFSMAAGVLSVICLGLSGETYAVTIAFLLLAMKTILLFRRTKAKG